MKEDQILVEQAKQGDMTAFSSLVSRHQKTMLRLAVRMTRELELGEDIVQEAFVKAYRKIHMFEGRSSFKSWLYQITINTAKNKLRVRKLNSVDIDKTQIAVAAQAEGRLVEMDLKSILREEVAKLPDRQKMALNLRVFDELSFKEIAVIMGCPYDTAKANYRHGLMKLRHQFESNNLLQQFRNFENEADHLKQVAEVKI